MNTIYIYIHGLHSSINSFKYEILKKSFENTMCIEWYTDSNVSEILDNFIENEMPKTKIYDNVVIIGDSTGGNFACQLRDRLWCKRIYTGLVLTNPLLSLKSVYDETIIPDNIKKYVIDIEKIEDAILILSNNDTVLDHSKISDYIQSCTYIHKVNDEHKLLTFGSNISMIDEYANNIHL